MGNRFISFAMMGLFAFEMTSFSLFYVVKKITASFRGQVALMTTYEDSDWLYFFSFTFLGSQPESSG